jgi:uncharacterized protein YigA (DUF484 family)
MQKQNKLTNYNNPSVCAWKLESYNLQIVLINNKENKHDKAKNLQQNQWRKLKTRLAKLILLKVRAKKSRFPKVERSKSLKVVAKAFEEPNMHKHDAKNA